MGNKYHVLYRRLSRLSRLGSTQLNKGFSEALRALLTDAMRVGRLSV
jgi:hypothetical protein